MCAAQLSPHIRSGSGTPVQTLRFDRVVQPDKGADRPCDAQRRPRVPSIYKSLAERGAKKDADLPENASANLQFVLTNAQLRTA